MYIEVEMSNLFAWMVAVFLGESFFLGLGVGFLDLYVCYKLCDDHSNNVGEPRK